MHKQRELDFAVLYGLEEKGNWGLGGGGGGGGDGVQNEAEKEGVICLVGALSPVNQRITSRL